MAVGFAASILTFIDISHQITSGTLEVAKSGSTSENENLEVIIKDLHDITQKLSCDTLGNSQHEQALKSLASECKELSNELVKVLQKLKTTAGSSKWKSIRVVLRNMWKKGEIAELEARLDKYRSQILFRMVMILK